MACKFVNNIRSGLAKVFLAGLTFVALQMNSQVAARQSGPSVVVQLARELQDLPLPMRSDFAWLALTQMAEFYTEEAARARRELRHSTRARDASHWAAAVDDYAREMSVLAKSITSATPISINVDGTNSVYVYVDGHPVIITGAIGGQQSDYELRVLERFCTLYICEDLLPEMTDGEDDLPAVVQVTDGSTAYWSFSQYAGPVCLTDDGLEFQFRQMSDLGEKRVACTRVVAELSELASVIARNSQQGVSVDWSKLKVLPAPGEGQQRVMLAQGVVIRLPLPMLAASPELLKMVRPWLKARIQGETFQLVVLNAEHLLGLEATPASKGVIQRYPAFNPITD